MIPRSTPDIKLANLIIAGVNKAGTTSLFHYLSAHPEICGSKDKETCYFLPLLYDKDPGPVSEYQQQFSQCGNTRYRLEATPGYITGGKKIADAIATTTGAKIIIILKEPVERLVSFYKRKKATLQLPENISFSQFVSKCEKVGPDDLNRHENHLYSALAVGNYSAFLEPWLERFGSDLKIVFFDDLQKDPKQFMLDLAKWLQIDGDIYTDFNFDVRNRSMGYKNQLVQQIAVNANLAGQRFWRSNPGIKKNLLSLYYKLNGAGFPDDDITEVSLDIVSAYYKPHNVKLHALLSRYGINENLPSWLEPEIVPA